MESADPGPVSDGDSKSHRRLESIQDWLRRRTDTALGRLALQWFRGYFAASRNSGCAVTVYSSLSVLPAALVAVAYFHPFQGNANVFAERLVAHIKLTGTTATLVEGTFGRASSNALAATVAVVISCLIWGIGIGQIYQDVYARAWRITVGSIADQGLFALFFVLVSGAIAVAVVSAAKLHEAGYWSSCQPGWWHPSRSGYWCRACSCIGSIGFRALLPGALLASMVTRRRRRDFAVVSRCPAEPKRKGVRLVRRRTNDARLRLHLDHPVAGVRRLLARLDELARDREAAARLRLLTAVNSSRFEVPVGRV